LEGHWDQGGEGAKITNRRLIITEWGRKKDYWDGEGMKIRKEKRLLG
jgi:hypothetical protein